MTASPLCTIAVRTVGGVQVGLDSTDDGVVTEIEENRVHFDVMGISYDQSLAQAVYVDESGLVAEKSALAAAGDARVDDGVISGVAVVSRDDAFNGVIVAGGEYTLLGGEFDLVGDGRDDFTGVGAAVSASGDARLVVDGARIRTRGYVRTALALRERSHTLVKDTEVETHEGVLPDDYVPSPEFGRMWCVPWMLGLDGNCRAVQFVGDHSSAVFVRSRLRAEKWGVISNDISDGARVVTIDCDIATTGDSGYGVYALGGAHHQHVGTRIDVADIGGVFDEGTDSEGLPNTLHVYDSTPERLAALNETLPIPLSAEDLATIETRPTVIRSARFGFMIHVSIAADANPTQLFLEDNTRVETGKATFLVKGVGADIEVGPDVVLTPENGVLLQVIDSDDPGPRFDADGRMVSTGVFREKPGRAEKVVGFDVSAEHAGDIRIRFRGTTATGDLINGWRNGTGPNRMGGESGIADEPEPSGKNLLVALDDGASLEGVVSSAFSRHLKEEIGADDWRLLGEVTNTREPAINNGAIVTLHGGSTWIPTGTSYLTRLVIDDASSLTGSVTVDGRAVDAAPGVYTGAIVVQPA